MNNIFKECNTYTNEIVKELKNLYENEIKNIRKLCDEKIAKLESFEKCKNCEKLMIKLKQQKQLVKDLQFVCKNSHDKVSQR